MIPQNVLVWMDVHSISTVLDDSSTARRDRRAHTQVRLCLPQFPPPVVFDLPPPKPSHRATDKVPATPDTASTLRLKSMAPWICIGYLDFIYFLTINIVGLSRGNQDLHITVTGHPQCEWFAHQGSCKAFKGKCDIYEN